jgi:hypothetical protein
MCCLVCWTQILVITRTVGQERALGGPVTAQQDFRAPAAKFKVGIQRVATGRSKAVHIFQMLVTRELHK